MIAVLTSAGWSLAAFLAGWITATPALRTGGAIGLVVFGGMAALVNHYWDVTHGPVPLNEKDVWGDVDGPGWDWPERTA